MDTKNRKVMELQENKAAKEDLNEAQVLNHAGDREDLEQRNDNKVGEERKEPPPKGLPHQQVHSLSLISPAKPLSISDLVNHSHDD